MKLRNDRKLDVVTGRPVKATNVLTSRSVGRDELDDYFYWDEQKEE